MDKTKIDWADSTWNPVTGCLHKCRYCYARSIAQRFATKEEVEPEDEGLTFPLDDPERFPVLNAPYLINGKQQPYPFGFAPTFHRYRLGQPKVWSNKSRTIFVCSMVDLFGEWVPDSWIQEVMDACCAAPQHRYLFLTKNYLRASEFRYENNWWIGRTITHTEPCGNKDKNHYLCYGVPKAKEPVWRDHPNTFISVEPIQGPVTDLAYYAHDYGYKWVIVGAETGNSKEKNIPKREWIDKIISDCELRKIPIFMKESLRSLMWPDFRQEFPWEKQVE